jgi:hypothetical protein
LRVVQGVIFAAPGDEGPVLSEARDGVLAPHGPHEQPDEVGERSDRLPAHHQALFDDDPQVIRPLVALDDLELPTLALGGTGGLAEG